MIADCLQWRVFLPAFAGILCLTAGLFDRDFGSFCLRWQVFLDKNASISACSCKKFSLRFRVFLPAVVGNFACNLYVLLPAKAGSFACQSQANLHEFRM